MKTGAKLFSAVCETEVVVVRAADVSLECGGRPMVEDPGERELDGGPAAALAGGSELGKRYVDEESKLQVLCVRPGAGALSADGRQLTVIETKQLPSSD